MSQLDNHQMALFDPMPPPAVARQHEQLERVTSRIGALVLEFCEERIASGHREFFAAELRAFIAGRTTTAPASPDRILRALRSSGQINYRVVSRSKSLYELITANNRA